MDMNKLFKFYWKKENQILILQMRFFCWLFSFSSFFFSFSHFSIFFNVKNGVTPLFIAVCEGCEQIVEILLEKGESNVDLPDEVFLLIVFFFFFFHFLIFLFFFNVKDGATPLYMATQNGDEQIVQILLEKGKPNVDLPDKVILLIVFFFPFFFFHFLIFLFFEYKEWNNSSLYCCSKWRWTNCWNFIGKRKTKCWSCRWGYFVDCFLFFFFYQFLIFLFFF